MSDDPFKFVHAAKVTLVATTISPQTFSEIVRQPFLSFQRNLRRSADAAGAVAYLLGFVELREELLQELGRSCSGLSNATPTDVSAIAKKRVEILHEGLDGDVFNRGINALEDTVGVYAEQLRHGIESIMAAQLIGAWTAFEALIEDVWIKCLNARPRLGFTALNAEPSDGDTEEELDRKKSRKIQIPVELLKQPGFNACEQMGTVLTAMRKWDFARRNDAADAYRAAFGKDFDKISELFRGAELRWLAAIRNNLVHSAGIADRELLKLVNDNPQLRNMKNGQAIPVDGEIVTFLISVADNRGLDLLKFASDWLESNPR